MPARNYQKDLAASLDPKYEPFWQSVYREYFPNLLGTITAPPDTESQRRGVDRVLYLDNGKTVTIDEKLDSTTTGNFFLEYVSGKSTNAPGWMNKNLSVDYIAYAFTESRKCYMLEWQTLRRVWRYYGQYWITKYGAREIKNKGYGGRVYYTVGVPVPVEELTRCMGRAHLVQFDSE